MGEQRHRANGSVGPVEQGGELFALRIGKIKAFARHRWLLLAGVERHLTRRLLEDQCTIARSGDLLSCPAPAGKEDHPKGGGRGVGLNETLSSTAKRQVRRPFHRARAVADASASASTTWHRLDVR